MQSQRSPQRAEKAALNCGSRQLIMLNMNGVRRYAHLLRKTRKPRDKSVGESRIRMRHLNSESWEITAVFDIAVLL